MRRALGQFWPRAESNLYEEPKKLVALGLATAAAETVGKRSRTVYTITPEGRRALEEWMPTAAAGPVLEFEELIRVFFAEFGSKSDLLAGIERARQWAADETARTVAIPRAYLQGEGPFPERLPWLILTGRFLFEFVHSVDRWAEWAEGVVRDWPDDIRQARPDWPTLERMALEGDALARRATQRSPSEYVQP